MRILKTRNGSGSGFGPLNYTYTVRPIFKDSMDTHTYPFVTGGVKGWNLILGEYNREHAYEVLQDVSDMDSNMAPLYAVRVDGEWTTRAQSEAGLNRLIEQVKTANRVWYKRNQARIAAELKAQQDAAYREQNPAWGLF